MSYGQKVEAITSTITENVSDILQYHLDDAIAIAEQISAYSNGCKMLKWLSENSNNQPELISFFISAAAVSDLLHIIKQSVLADDHVDRDELDVASDLLSDVMHRFSWIEGYSIYEDIIDNDDVIDLLNQWENDDYLLGGNYSNGAVVMPFSMLVVLASIISKNPSLHDDLTHLTVLIAKMILSVDSMNAPERDFLSGLKTHRRNERTLIVGITESLATTNTCKNTSFSWSPSSAIAISEEGPAKALESAIKELDQLIGVNEVKAEVRRLANFLKIRQQRLTAGLPIPSQSLHFVFTGNPGTGKTTVARIISRILYGFEVLKSPTLIESDRSMMVGGYVGQTAIKTSEMIEKAINGVLFIDEAYTLSKGDSSNDFGQEAIDTLLKKMEDHRDKLVVIAAGYPELMSKFVASNPGLESRFTRHIHFEDYRVPALCQIYERMCNSNSYKLTPQARANLFVLFSQAYKSKDEKFGNARYVRNIYEKSLGNHADRLANIDGTVNTEMLSTLEAQDLPYNTKSGGRGQIDFSNSRWGVRCPSCDKLAKVGLPLIGNRVNCKCGAKFRCPWWNLQQESVTLPHEFIAKTLPEDLYGYDQHLAAE